jgi:prepilin-type processing-associated H-X9-DG protein
MSFYPTRKKKINEIKKFIPKREFFCRDGLYDGKLNWLHVDGGGSRSNAGFWDGGVHHIHREL